MLQVQYNRYEAPSALANFQFTNGFTTRTAATDGTGDLQAEERAEILPDGASGWMSLVVVVDEPGGGPS